MSDIRDVFPAAYDFLQDFSDAGIDLVIIIKSYFHLGGMDIDIYKFRLKFYIEHGNGEGSLHLESVINRFYCIVDNIASDISSVDKI